MDGWMHACMVAQMGASNVTAENIWKILSSNPTFNGLTTFSTVMSAGQGAYVCSVCPVPVCVCVCTCMYVDCGCVFVVSVFHLAAPSARPPLP